MDIKSILEKPLSVESKETVSRAVSEMIRKKRHEILVFDKKEYKGIVIARDIIKRRVDPESTKIDMFIRVINPVLPEVSPEDAANMMLINDYKTLPVRSGENILLVTKTGILNKLKGSPTFKGKSAGDVMRFPYCISETDSVATAKSVIRDFNISRLPVLNSKGRVEGLLDTLDLLKAVVVRERPMLGERSREKIALEEIPVRYFIRRDIPRVKKKAPLRKVIDLITGCHSAVVVEENGKLLGLITPKDVLKLIGKRKEGVYVNISGIKEEDYFIKNILDEETANFIKKLSRTITINNLVMHVSRHKEGGKRTKYSVSSRLYTSIGAFFAHDFAWDLTKSVGNNLDKLERAVAKKKERRDQHKE